MRVLVSRGPNGLREYWGHPAFGVMDTPRVRTYLADYAAAGGVWAADNDCFNGGLDEAAWLRMLDANAGTPGCLWAAVPDVVADAAATLALFGRWAPVVADMGYPLALVAQNGLTPDMVPWEQVACLFVGGDTVWKLGPEAHRLVVEATERGLLAHMGRVNSLRRLRYAKAIGCDSVDGTRYARFADLYLRRALDFAAADGQVAIQWPHH